MNENAAEVLKQIADKLDVPVQQLWAGLVAYAPFIYYQWLAGLALGLVICAISFGCLLYCIRKNDDTAGVFLLILVCAVTATGVGVLTTLPDAMAAKMAPEAWATQQIVRKIGR